MALFPSIVLESANRSLRFRHMAFSIPPLGGSRPGISLRPSRPLVFQRGSKAHALRELAHNSPGLPFGATPGVRGTEDAPCDGCRGRGARPEVKDVKSGSWFWRCVARTNPGFPEASRFGDRSRRSVADHEAHLIVRNRMWNATRMPVIRRWTNKFMSWQISRLCCREVPDSGAASEWLAMNCSHSCTNRAMDSLLRLRTSYWRLAMVSDRIRRFGQGLDIFRKLSTGLQNNPKQMLIGDPDTQSSLVL